MLSYLPFFNLLSTLRYPPAPLTGSRSLLGGERVGRTMAPSKTVIVFNHSVSHRELGRSNGKKGTPSTFRLTFFFGSVLYSTLATLCRFISFCVIAGFEFTLEYFLAARSFFSQGLEKHFHEAMQTNPYAPAIEHVRVCVYRGDERGA